MSDETWEYFPEPPAMTEQKQREAFEEIAEKEQLNLSQINGWYTNYRTAVAWKYFVKGIMQAAIAQSVPAVPSETAMRRFEEIESECDDLKSETPLERLRFFCSLAMTNGQDWLDVEPFFDALEAAAPSAPIADRDAPVTLKVTWEDESGKESSFTIEVDGESAAKQKITLWLETLQPRNAIIEECAKVVEGEAVSEPTDNDSDEGYNAAIKHGAYAVRALKAEGGKAPNLPCNVCGADRAKEPCKRNDGKLCAMAGTAYAPPAERCPCHEGEGEDDGR